MIIIEENKGLPGLILLEDNETSFGLYVGQNYTVQKMSHYPSNNDNYVTIILFIYSPHK